MNTNMKMKSLVLSTLMLGAMPVYAGFMMGPPEAAREAAFETITSFTDEATTADLQAQRDAVTDLRSQLETLRSAETQDEEAIADAREQLREARQGLRGDIKDIVGENEELRDSLRDQRQAARAEHAVTHYALRDEDAFGELVDAASEEQATALQSNQDAIQTLRSEISDARAAGASREDVGELRDQIKTLAMEQKDIVGEVLEANDELKGEFLSEAKEIVRERRPGRNRPNRGG